MKMRACWKTLREYLSGKIIIFGAEAPKSPKSNRNSVKLNHQVFHVSCTVNLLSKSVQLIQVRLGWNVNLTQFKMGDLTQNVTQTKKQF